MSAHGNALPPIDDHTRDALVLSHFSLAHDHPIEDRIAAAAAAGFGSIGLYVGQYLSLRRAGRAPGELADLLAAYGLGISEIEVLRGWAEPTEAYFDVEAAAWEMADEFGCRYVQSIGPVPEPLDVVARGYGSLCDRAADHGLVVGLEFLPFTNVRTAAEAWRIVEAADRDNGGLCVDIWHHMRGADDLAMIEALPAEKITGVQLSDGPRTPVLDDYFEDCLRQRRPPGEGEFDVVGFLAALMAKGLTGPWSVEVCDERAWGEPATDRVRHLFEATSGAVASARRLAAGGGSRSGSVG